MRILSRSDDLIKLIVDPRTEFINRRVWFSRVTAQIVFGINDRLSLREHDEKFIHT